MLSISKPKTAAGAVAYFSAHLVEVDSTNPDEDYYTAEGSPGHWVGTGASALGLDGKINSRDFAAALLGQDPRSGDGLVQGAGKESRRAAWDLTFSAPKSVSAIWGVDDSQRDAIQAAHDAAIEQAMRVLQSEAIQARRGKGGIERESAKLVAAKFDHGTSREQDPQLHSHVVLANLGQRADGSWGGIDAMPFLKRQKMLGTRYRVHLADQLQQMGYQIERDKQSFRIVGVPADLEKAWSKRRRQIVNQMADLGTTGVKSAEKAALDTRQKKESVNQKALHERWQREAAEHGLDLETLDDLTSVWEHAPDEVLAKDAMPEPAELWQELTQHASTLSEVQLRAAVLERAQGVLSVKDAERYFDNLVADQSQTVALRDGKGERRYTSREMFQIERSLAISAAKRAHESHGVSHQAISAAFKDAPTLSPEQRAMVSHVTTGAGVVAVQGMAGTGKSYALGAAQTAWNADGKNVIGAALAGKAASELESGSGIKSQTLFSLLRELDPEHVETINGEVISASDQPARTLSSNDIIVLDEAGMVGSRQMKRLLDIAERQGAKVVLVGDTRQLQPIDAGGAMRAITNEIGAAELKGIRRQSKAWERSAIHQLADGDAGEALQAYKAHDRLHTDNKTIEDARVQTVLAWMADMDMDGGSIMLAATRADVRELNLIARDNLFRHTVDSRHVTINGDDFIEGERVLLTRNNKSIGVSNGDLGLIQGITEEGHLVVQVDGHEATVTIDPDEYDHIQYGYAITTHKAQGATVDHAHVLLDGNLSGREWSYVAGSRAREETHFYSTEELAAELDQTMSRSRQQDIVDDYEIDKQPTRERGYEMEM